MVRDVLVGFGTGQRDLGSIQKGLHQAADIWWVTFSLRCHCQEHKPQSLSLGHRLLACFLHFLLTCLVDFCYFCFHPSVEHFCLHSNAFFMTLPFFLLVPFSPFLLTAVPFPQLHSLDLCIHSSSATSLPPPQGQWNKSTSSLSPTTDGKMIALSSFWDGSRYACGFSRSCGGQCVSSRLRCSGCTVRFVDFWSDGPGTSGH